jgi:DNA-binding IscR family transcriptional regulator
VKRDSKLSDVLHVLLHLADHAAPVKSETMAKMLKTNPVVVRRILAGLRKHGFVSSEKGHGGGWQLSCDFYAVTLRDIYVALDSPPFFAIGVRSKSPHCLVEKAVNTAMNEAFDEAEALLLERFGQVTLARLVHLIHQNPRMSIDDRNEQKTKVLAENEKPSLECRNQEMER